MKRLPALWTTLGDRLTWWRRLAKLSLWVEFLAAHGWAQLSVVAAALGVAMLGLVTPGVLGPVLLLLTTAAAMLACVHWDRARPPLPTEAAAERRLERDSGLRHRPFAVLRDQPASPDPAQDFIWQIHSASARGALRRLRLGLPDAAMARRDPFAVRVAAMLLFVAGLVTAGDRANQRILDAFIPGLDAGPASPTLVQAWIQPPAYTGQPPIFLNQGGVTVQVPRDSRLNVSVTGGHFKPRLMLPGGVAKFHTTSPGAWQVTTLLTRSGDLAITRLFSSAGLWHIAILANDKPTASIPGVPGKAGKTTELKLPWQTAQRWGVAALQATLTPADHPDLPPITLPIALPGTPKDAHGALQADLTANPYAGAPMEARLTARDVSGQSGQSDVVRFTLPARDFKNPLARAIVDLRRRLALHDEAPVDAAADLDALMQTQAHFAGHGGVFLNVVSVAALLRDSPVAAGIAEAEARLWIVALALDGALPEASQMALDQARDALRRALKDRADGKISAADLARQMQKLRQALSQRLQDMARQAVKDHKLPPFDPMAQRFAAPQLDRLMKQIEQAAREGRSEDAQQKMAELERLLDKLKNARVLSPQQAEQARQAEKAGKQQTGAVKDMVQREAGLMDRAQLRAPRAPALPPEFADANIPPPPPDPDELEANEESRQQDANVQRALHQALDALKDAFSAGHKVPRSLDDASHDMQAATDALAQGQEPTARGAEARVIDDLRRGGQDMSKQMSEGAQMAIVPGAGAPGGEGDEFGMEPGGDDGTQRDPLGRPLHQGTGGKAVDDNSVHVPDAMEQGRSRQIQQELRRRGADRARPRDELDYIDRLLKAY